MALTTIPASLSATALTLTTAAQPNITSVGTLTGLIVNGTAGIQTGALTLSGANPALVISNSGDVKVNFVRSSNTISYALSSAASGGHGFYDNAASAYDLYMKAGKVGIGTIAMSSYYSKNLVVMADGDNTGGITIAAPATDDTTYLAFADGTSGAAAYAGYVGYAHNGDDLLLGAGGATRVTIDSTGNIGIGESNPARRLSVRRDTGITTGFNDISQFLDTTLGVGGSVSLNLGRANSTKNLGKMAFKYAGSGSNSNALNFGFYDADNLMTLLANGNVGIGTASPAAPIHVETIHEIATIIQSNHNNGTHFVIRNSDATTGRKAIINLAPANNVTGAYVGAEAMEDFSTTANRTADLFFSTRKDGNLSEKMRIDSNGDVGIGTTDPNTPLHFLKAATSSDVNYIKMQMPSWSGHTNYLKSIVWHDGSNDIAAIGAEYNGAMTNIHFHSQYNSAYKATSVRTMTIKGDGNVGIGTSSPGAKLEVSGQLYAGPVGTGDATTKAEMNTYNVLKLKPHNTNSTNMTIASVSNGDAMGIQVSNAAQTANWHIALNPFGGSVGIGTASPTRKLHIGGTAPGDSIIRQDATSSGTNWEIGEREAGKWMIFEDDGDSIVATFMSTGNVGIGTTAPTESLTVLGAISAKNGHEDLATHTLNSYASIVSSGTLEFTLGYNGSLAVGRVFTFTYEATSWKSWMFEIEVASTHGYTTIKSGGYNNNSNGKNIYEVGDAQNAGTLTHTNSGQHNVFTYTLNSSMIHPAFKIKYTQSGGDGAPRMDRMKLVIT